MGLDLFENNKSNDFPMTISSHWPRRAVASCSLLCRIEKEWKVVVGRISLMKVTLTLHAIEQFDLIFGSRCRYTGTLLYGSFSDW